MTLVTHVTVKVQVVRNWPSATGLPPRIGTDLLRAKGVPLRAGRFLVDGAVACSDGGIPLQVALLFAG